MEKKKTSGKKTVQRIIDHVKGMGLYDDTEIQNQLSDLKSYITIPEMHRNIFRGKNLGAKYTDTQKQAVTSGTFDDLFVGDYWEINGTVWRIVDIDFWYGQGKPACTKHHLIVMPDIGLYSGVMNDASTTEGGYALSKMRTEGLEQAKTIIADAFGAANILAHTEYLINAVSDGVEAGGAWLDSTVELPNEIMMYGCFAMKPMSSGNGNSSVSTTIARPQFAAMRLNPYLINVQRATTWLRDIASQTGFATFTGNGTISVANAKSTHWVRPFFGLTGGD